MNYIEIMRGAETIGLPKGENSRAYRRAFQDKSGLEIPITNSGQLSAMSQGRKFFWLRPLDIPARVDEKWLDIGIVGSDAYMEYLYKGRLCARDIGDAACRFSVLARPDKVQAVETAIASDRRYSSSMQPIPTSYPRMLNAIASWRDLPFTALGLDIQGSVEAYAELTGIGVVADIVDTGETAQANNLREVFKLCDIAPQLIVRTDSASL